MAFAKFYRRRFGGPSRDPAEGRFAFAVRREEDWPFGRSLRTLTAAASIMFLICAA
jgi:hypothetical protein